MRIALTGSAYQARSIIASAQRQVNLFAEKNPPGSIIDAGQQAGSITTLYPAPGLLPLASPPAAGAGRGLYWASSDTLFYVCGATLYQVTPNWTLTALGTIAPGTTPVSMADNGLTMGLFDGSANGYQVDLTTLAFSAINGAPTPAGNAPTVASTFVYGFYGSDRAAMLDGYLILNQPGTRNFYCTYNGEFVFDSLYIAAKNGFSDNLVAAVVNQRSLWLIGERTTEIWSDVGGATFPFAILPGPFVQQGCVAKYSIGQIGEVILWLSQDQTGTNVLLRTQGYSVERVSTHAIEAEWASYAAVADAVGCTFQQAGHQFYQINFPTGDRSWRYDLTSGEWHEAVWSDSNGAWHRHRAGCMAYAYGRVVVGDWETGALYALDPATFTDAGAPIVRVRGFPHIVADSDRVLYRSLILDMAAGNSLAPAAPQVLLRWSDDRGRTFGNPVAGSIGATGNYLTSIQYNRLGMARDRVFEVSWDAPIDTALQGAFVSFNKAAS